MKIARPLLGIIVLGGICVSGCGALSDSTNGQSGQSVDQQQAQNTSPTEDKTLEVVPTTTSIGGKTVTLQTLPSGVKYYDVKIGTGPEAKSGDSVNMLYTGTLLNGTKFDSTADHGGTPFNFTLGVGQVIKGWDFGVVGMQPGGQRRLVIPGSLAYGPQGQGSTIPPNATLLFDVTLISIGKK